MVIQKIALFLCKIRLRTYLFIIWGQNITYQLVAFSWSQSVHLPVLTTHQATLEADAQRGNERAEGAEKKITDIEEELRVRER